MKKFLPLIVIAILVWGLWPTGISPVSYTPPADKGFFGPFSENDALVDAETLPLAEGFGPEDVAVDSQGRIYGGLQDGRIVRLSVDGQQQEIFATIEGGRPLGLHFDEEERLIVADAWTGLLSIAMDGTITRLSHSHGGRPFAFTNDLDIASDGKIYFTDASDTYGQPEYRLDLLEGRPHGRLLVFDPQTGETRMLLDDLFFANGVALSENEDFILVNETARYRVLRYWLKGAKAGERDVFIDNLPGFPDGISSNRKGSFWLALPSPRNPAMDTIHPQAWLKKLVAKLPAFLQPSAIRRGIVVELNEAGDVVQTYHDPAGDVVYMVTSVEQVGDTLYLGSLEAPQIARLKLK